MVPHRHVSCIDINVRNVFSNSPCTCRWSCATPPCCSWWLLLMLAKCKSRQWSSWLQTQQKTDSGREDASGSLCHQKFTAENFPPLLLLLANPNFLCCAEEALLLSLLLLLLLFPLCCCVPFSSLSWMRGANVSRWKCCTGEEFAKITQKKLPKKSKLFLSFFWQKLWVKSWANKKKLFRNLSNSYPAPHPRWGQCRLPLPFPDVCLLSNRSIEGDTDSDLASPAMTWGLTRGEEAYPKERSNISFFSSLFFPIYFSFSSSCIRSVAFLWGSDPICFFGEWPLPNKTWHSFLLPACN